MQTLILNNIKLSNLNIIMKIVMKFNVLILQKSLFIIFFFFIINMIPTFETTKTIFKFLKYF